MLDMVYRLDPEIIIGQGSLSRAGSICNARGGKALIVCEQGLYERNSIDRLESILRSSGSDSILFDEVSSQSTSDIAQDAADIARRSCSNLVIGFGSLRTQAIARMTAIIAASDISVFDLLDGKISKKPFLPYIAIPAIDADPFMFTNYFLALDPRDRSIKLIKTPAGMCNAVIIDNALYVNNFTNEKVIATAAFDGFCTAAEAYCSTKANSFSDGLLEQSFALYSSIIKSKLDNPGPNLIESWIDATFLTAMGCSISSPGIGTALAYCISGRFPVAKTWCSTVILPHILEKLSAAKPDKMAKIAANMGEPVEGSSIAEAAAMVTDTIRHYMGLLQVPGRLKEFNLILDHLGPAAEAARDLEFVSYSPWTVASENAFDVVKLAF